MEFKLSAARVLFGLICTLLIGCGKGGVSSDRRDTSDSADSDVQRLRGTWYPASVEFGGSIQTGEAFESFAKAFSLSFDGYSFVNSAPDQNNRGTFRLEPSKRPREITMVRERGGEVLGIYEFRGDRLMLCAGKPDSPRPADFTTRPGSSAILMELTRRPP